MLYVTILAFWPPSGCSDPRTLPKDTSSQAYFSPDGGGTDVNNMAYYPGEEVERGKS